MSDDRLVWETISDLQRRVKELEHATSQANAVWIVVQQGIGRHDISGPYPSLPVATSAAADIAREELDGYHVYEIFQVKSPATEIGEPFKTVARISEGESGRVAWWWSFGRYDHISRRRNPDGYIDNPRSEP